MSKLSEEIMGMPAGMYGEPGIGWHRAIREAAKLVEKRDSERVEKIKAMIDKHRPEYDGDYVDGRTDAVKEILNMEDA